MHRGRLLVGVVLVVLGLVFLLDRLGVASADRLFSAFWPLLIIAAGVLQLAVTRRASPGPAIMIGIGIVLLAATLNLVPPSFWQLFWPLVLIAIGVLFLAGVVSRGGLRQADQRDDVNVLSVLGGQRLVGQSQQGRGGPVTSVFGGVTLDLRNANLAPEGAAIDAMSAFGGVEILVPEGWRVEMNGIPIFGGFENRTTGPATGVAEGRALHVRGTALFGSVVVRNRTDTA